MAAITSAHSELERITRTIVEQFRPRRIVLVGSRASGDARADSDYDILVELEIPGREWDTKDAIRRAIGACDHEIDVHVRAPGALECRRDDPGWLDYDVAREGIVLYAAYGVSIELKPPPRGSERRPN